MTSDLVLDMRTCAAALLSDSTKNAWANLIATDAARLLVEASNLLDVPEPLGELMPVLPGQNKTVSSGVATWTTGKLGLPEATAKPCPSCGNVAARKVRIANRHLFLTCPMCAHEWEYKP